MKVLGIKSDQEVECMIIHTDMSLRNAYFLETLISGIPLNGNTLVSKAYIVKFSWIHWSFSNIRTL